MIQSVHTLNIWITFSALLFCFHLLGDHPRGSFWLVLDFTRLHLWFPCLHFWLSPFPWREEDYWALSVESSVGFFGRRGMEDFLEIPLLLLIGLWIWSYFMICIDLNIILLSLILAFLICFPIGKSSCNPPIGVGIFWSIYVNHQWNVSLLKKGD